MGDRLWIPDSNLIPGLWPLEGCQPQWGLLLAKGRGKAPHSSFWGRPSRPRTPVTDPALHQFLR